MSLSMPDALHTSTATDEPHISVHEPENALPRVCLADLPESIRAACARAGWQNLMPVQSLALPYLLARRDIMVQSRTGSGKTGCYLLPMLPKLDPQLKAPQALVLAPTRELAVQVEREADTIFADTGIIPVALYGGVGYGKQMEALRAGAQLVVGTPGRVLDHLLRHTLDLNTLRVLVFDEADRMLSIPAFFRPPIRPMCSSWLLNSWQSQVCSRSRTKKSMWPKYSTSFAKCAPWTRTGHWYVCWKQKTRPQASFFATPRRMSIT